MATLKYLEYIVNEIHSTVVATADDNGLPVTCAIDMMDFDDNGLYFLTAKGKKFYERLVKRGYLSLTGIKGEDTMSCVAVSFGGKVREIGTKRLERLIEKNPYMNEIYPDAESQTALTVFQIYEGDGEWFDLAKKPIERASFTLGRTEEIKRGYYVTDKCTGCNLCAGKCPQKCIDTGKNTVVIRQNNCLNCGNCYEICPFGAIVKCG